MLRRALNIVPLLAALFGIGAVCLILARPTAIEVTRWTTVMIGGTSLEIYHKGGLVADVPLRPVSLLLVGCLLMIWVESARQRWAATRLRKRRWAGLCLRCGYDIRASRDRCPECGAQIEFQPGM